MLIDISAETKKKIVFRINPKPIFLHCTRSRHVASKGFHIKQNFFRDPPQAATPIPALVTLGQQDSIGPSIVYKIRFVYWMVIEILIAISMVNAT